VTYRRKDAYHRRAKSAGYRARSAYKLIELDERFRLLRAGDHVVDLGAWPGGWLQVALERIGTSGRLVALDVVPIAPLGAPNVFTITGDVRDPGTIAAVRGRLGRLADAVLSDVAPKLSGIRATDEARRAELADAVLSALPALLRSGGSLLIKVFMDPGYEALIERLGRTFASVRTTRPEASRRGSAELYVLALGYLAPEGAAR
jgi:23S rRNA (uridine2552-2'-O)-methyltransferase